MSMLYAWVNNTVDGSWPLIVYTDTENPTITSKLYNANGEELNLHDYTSKPTAEIYSANTTKIEIYYGNAG